MSRVGQKVITSLAPRLGYAYIRVLRTTMRLDYRNREALERARAESGPYILAFWHCRFVMMPFAYPDRRIVTLSSRHRDSLMLAQVMRRFGIEQAWGSSTRGGTAGMRELLRRIKSGYDAALTPDGPKGPRRRVQPGVIAAARMSGKPIVPVSFSARPSRRLRTWDRTLLPYPFGKGRYVYGEPMRIPRRADGAEQESLRLALENELDRLTDELDREMDVPVEEPRPEVDG
jgi:lysophospholipid acyltransferase (LPLAT)-like uncharacterized protein